MPVHASQRPYCFFFMYIHSVLSFAINILRRKESRYTLSFGSFLVCLRPVGLEEKGSDTGRDRERRGKGMGRQFLK